MDQSQITSADDDSGQPQDKPQATNSESTVISTKNKTGSNSNDEDVEEKKSGSLDIADMSSEQDFPDRGTNKYNYSLLGNKNIDTIIEDPNDGEIGEDGLQTFVNPKGKGERQIKNTRAKKTGRLLDVPNVGNNRESLYNSIYQVPEVEVDENYMKNKDNKLVESIYDPGSRSQSMYFSQPFGEDRATMKSFVKGSEDDKKHYVYSYDELRKMISQYEEACKPIFEKR